MKLRNLLPIYVMVLVLLTASCSKEKVNSLSSVKASTDLLKNKDALVGIPAVNLGLAGEFMILSKSGIADVYKSNVTGDIGSSPITGAVILISCPEVTGTIYSLMQQVLYQAA